MIRLWCDFPHTSALVGANHLVARMGWLALGPGPRKGMALRLIHGRLPCRLGTMPPVAITVRNSDIGSPTGLTMMRPCASAGASLHLRQEAEANRFAIALLAPLTRVAPFLSASADLRQALAMARALDLSKTAAVRRYVTLHAETLAVVFSHGERVLYVDRQDGFPFLSVWNGDRPPTLPAAGEACPLEWKGVDSRDWVKAGGHIGLYAQTLQQADGYAMTLLRAEGEDRGGVADGQPRLQVRR